MSCSDSSTGRVAAINLAEVSWSAFPVRKTSVVVNTICRRNIMNMESKPITTVNSRMVNPSCAVRGPVVCESVIAPSASP